MQGADHAGRCNTCGKPVPFAEEGEQVSFNIKQGNFTHGSRGAFTAEGLEAVVMASRASELRSDDDTYSGGVLGIDRYGGVHPCDGLAVCMKDGHMSKAASWSWQGRRIGRGARRRSLAR